MKKIFFDKNQNFRAIFAVIAGLIVIIISSILGNLSKAVLSSLRFVPPAAVVIAEAFVYGGGALLLSYIVLNFIYKKQIPEDIDCYKVTKRSISKLMLGLIAGVVCISCVVLSLHLTGVYRITYAGAGNFAVSSIILSFIFFIAVGIAEEITVRGIMQRSISKFGLWPSVLIIGAVFGMLHMSNPGATWNAVIGVGLAGVMLGMSMYATNSIMFPIGLHITWNWAQGSLFGVPVSGLEVQDSILQSSVINGNELLSGGQFGAEASLACLILLTTFTVAFYIYGKKKGRFEMYKPFLKKKNDLSIEENQ